MTITRTDLARLLSLGTIVVTFTKLDGTERVMECTQDPHLIPEGKRATQPGEFLSEVPSEQDQMRVFDVEVGDWRSFRVSSVKEVRFRSEPEKNKLLSE